MQVGAAPPGRNLRYFSDEHICSEGQCFVFARCIACGMFHDKILEFVHLLSHVCCFVCTVTVNVALTLGTLCVAVIQN